MDFIISAFWKWLRFNLWPLHVHLTQKCCVFWNRVLAIGWFNQTRWLCYSNPLNTSDILCLCNLLTSERFTTGIKTLSISSCCDSNSCFMFHSCAITRARFMPPTPSWWGRDPITVQNAFVLLNIYIFSKIWLILQSSFLILLFKWIRV